MLVESIRVLELVRVSFCRVRRVAQELGLIFGVNTIHWYMSHYGPMFLDNKKVVDRRQRAVDSG